MNIQTELDVPCLDEIKTAVKRIGPYAHQTPVLTCTTLNQMVGAQLYFKCENFQKIGAFKFRGAVNAVFSLSDQQAEKGVCTHSSGNHAQALALAAKLRGIRSFIIMPEVAPVVKVEGVKGYGGEVIFCKPTQQAREETLKQVQARTGAEFIHPYNDLRVITGQATAAYELIHEIPDLDIVMTPVGGGGLLSGTALASHYLSPQTSVYAAEPKEADDACRSLKEGEILPSLDPGTIADGLLTSLGSLTFPIIQKYVKEIKTVTEENIIRAMKTMWERMKIVVEPSGAVPFGVLLEHKEAFKGRRIGIIISGGNVDLTRLPWLS
jgi:threonine dehydratase